MIMYWISILKPHIKLPDIHIRTNNVSVVRVSDGYLQCLDKEDIIHAYNLDDIHAYHVDRYKVRFYEVNLWNDLQNEKLK